MPVQATTTLPQANEPTLGNGVEDEVSASVADETNNGDYRFQIKETGTTGWDSNSTGFAETVVASDSDTSGTVSTVFAGLEDGEEYEVRVRAETDDVTGAWSPVASIVTKFPGASNLSLTVDSDTAITATWTDNSDNEDGFKVFVAEEKDPREDTGFTAFSEVADLAPNTTSYQHTNLKPNHDYKFYIRAYTEHTAADSSTVTATTNIDSTLAQDLVLRGASDTIQLGPSEIVAKDLEKVATGVGTARVDVPAEDAIIPYVQRQDRVNYRVDQTTVFTGYAVGFAGNERTGKWTLRVDGIAKRLEETRPDYDSLGGTLTYSSIALHDALKDYWPRTPFSATVTEQTPDVVADDEELQAADTTSEWKNITSLSASDPFVIENGSLVGVQTCFVSEGEDPDASTDFAFRDDTDYSNGQAASLTSGSASVTYQVTPSHTIPASAVGVAVRDEASDTPGFTWTLNGDTVDSLPQSTGTLALGWSQIGDGTYSGDGYTGGDLQAGTTYELTCEIDAVGSGEALWVDAVAVYDNRYTYTWDNTVDSNGYLSGPELYPDAATITFPAVKTAYNIDSSSVTTTWNDTSNGQAIAASNDGGTTYTSQGNTQSLSVDYSDAGRTGQVKLTFSRYGSRTSQTPTTGFKGHVVQDYQHTVDLNDLVVIDRLELSRNHFENLKKLHNYGDFLWTIEHASGDVDTLTVNSYPRGAITKSTPQALQKPENRNPEVAAETYFNSIYLQGALQPDGTRPSARVQDDAAVANDGRVISPGVLRDTSISTEAGAVFRANALLQTALNNNDLRGSVTTHPEYIHPGYQYGIDFDNDGTAEPKTLERVSIRESAGSVDATYEFVVKPQLAETLNSLKSDQRDLGDNV